MDETELAVIVMSFLVVVMAVAVVLSSVRTSRFADKALEHCMAFHTDQREFMRIRFDSDHQEFLLREARARAAREERRYDHLTEKPDPPPGDPMIPIESDTNTQ